MTAVRDMAAISAEGDELSLLLPKRGESDEAEEVEEVSDMQE